jgi:hypothetical protein
MFEPTPTLTETYLVPRVDWDEDAKHWDAFIEERTNDEADETVFAWHIRVCATPMEALEAVTTEYVRMMSNMIAYAMEEIES